MSQKNEHMSISNTTFRALTVFKNNEYLMRVNHLDKFIFTGASGSGKTTLGKEIARIFDYEFIDMDSLIKKETGLKISQIFSNKGEEYFRSIETSILEKIILNDKKLIISTGGGIVLRNQKILKKTYNIYLECNINTLVNGSSPTKNR